MKKIWSLLDEELESSSLEKLGYMLIDNEESECDVLICEFEHAEYADALTDPQETLFVMALDNPKEQKHSVPEIFDAWVDKAKIQSVLPTMLERYKTQIEQKIKLRKQRVMIERLSVDTSVHYANLDGIKYSMRDSTKEIESIFEERVEEMRSIHKATQEAHEKLTNLKSKMVPQEFEELEESWNMTESILGRTDEVIKAMFGFITVLQCEDRITQMIDGIGNIMNNDLEYLFKEEVFVKSSDEVKLKERLVEFYTIQDQRDYVQGIDTAMQGCKPKQTEMEEILLF